MDTFELLTQAGLSKKEASVYASLLEHGHQSLSDLNKETQINRPALYQVLPMLERRGLISRVKNKKRYRYAAESPEKLLEQYSQQIESEKNGLKELVKNFPQAHSVRPVVKYFEGSRGVKFVFDDVINTLPVGGEFYRYSSRIDTKTKNFDKTQYSRLRDERKIERLVITSEERAKDKGKKLERAVRTVPKEFSLFEDNISLVLYGGKTAYVDYGSETAFIIESEKIAKFHQKLFKLMWKSLK